MRKKKTDYWDQIFDKFDILSRIKNDGEFIIKASQINEFREARLMVKFDHINSLPNIFKENKLAILPVSRSSFVIGHFNPFHSISPLQENDNIEIFPFPEGIETIDRENLYSESSALLCAYNTSMIDTVIGEQSYFTVNGRMSTQEFSFNIKNTNLNSQYNIKVKNSICEIDGGFEDSSSFTIVEVKNFKIDDFIIRQLYYPYRLWKSKIRKDVKLLFLTFSNDIFTFYKCKFTDDLQYNSIVITETRKFMLEQRDISLQDIVQLIEKSNIVKENVHVPFPQADDFFRVIDILNLLYVNNMTKDEITLKYGFDIRQTDYYTNSGIYLGLVSKYRDASTKKVSYRLSDIGNKIMCMKQRNKYLSIIELILQHEVFYETVKLQFDTGRRPTKEEIIELMKKATINMNKNAPTTLKRRASTVLGWCDWIFRQSVDSFNE